LKGQFDEWEQREKLKFGRNSGMCYQFPDHAALQDWVRVRKTLVKELGVGQAMNCARRMPKVIIVIDARLAVHQIKTISSF
jgi:hypothetical protein